MKTARQRISAILLTAALLLSMLPAAAGVAPVDMEDSETHDELNVDSSVDDVTGAQTPEEIPVGGEDLSTPPAEEVPPVENEDPVMPPDDGDASEENGDSTTPPAEDDLSDETTGPEGNEDTSVFDSREGAPVIPGYTQYTGDTLDTNESYLIVTQSSDNTIYALYASVAGKNIGSGSLTGDNGACTAELVIEGDSVTAKYLKDDAPLVMDALHLSVGGDSSTGYTFSANGVGVLLGDMMFADTAASLSVSNANGDYILANSTANRVLSFNKNKDEVSQYPNHITDFWGPGSKGSFPIYLYTVNQQASGSELESLIDEVNTLQQSDYTAASWAVLQNALSYAQDIMGNADASEADIMTAFNQLKAAKNGLVGKLTPIDPPGSGITEYIQDTNGIDSGAVYAIVTPTATVNGVTQNRILYHTGSDLTNRVATTISNGKIALNSGFDPRRQLWTVTAVNGGYTLQSLDSSRYLDLSSACAENINTSADPVTLTITENNDGTYQISQTDGSVVSFDPTDGNIYAGTDPVDLYFFKQTESSAIIEGDGRPQPGTTTGQPFPKGLAGSEYFRIPALVTLPSGRLVAASDARWSHIYDACGIDIIVSYSDDNGETWHYNFPNYFNDGTDSKQLNATAFIDPLMTVGKDGTIYLLVDLFPGSFAINTAPNRPDRTTGFVEINGKQRMPLYTSINGQNDSNYTYYIGDFSGGFAPVLEAYDGSASGFYVYYGPTKEPTYCPQQGSSAWVKQNVFYYNSILHVRNATYLWLVTSKDGGETWSAPTILNPQIRRTSGTVQFYGVGPGAVECLDDGTLVLPCYTFQVGGANNASQIASFIYSTDNGVTWHRSQDSTDGSHWSSESATVPIDNNTIRHFYRDGYSTLWYTDHTRSGNGWVAGTPVDTGVPNTSNNQLSVLRYSQPIDGKTAILVSTATGSGGSRTNGKIYTFLLNSDNTMNLAYTYVVNDNGADYVYSSLAELKDGSIGLLYEYENNPSAAITFVNYTIEELTANVSKDELRTLVREVEAMDEEGYTAGSWAALQTALTSAQAVLDKADATATEISGAVAALKEARSKLEFSGPPSTVTHLEYIQDTDGIDSGAVYAILTPPATDAVRRNRILYHSGNGLTDKVDTLISDGKTTLNSGFPASRQLWRVTETAGGYTLQSLDSSRYLDLSSASTRNINTSANPVTLTITENGDGTYQVGHTSGNVVSFGSSDGNIYAGMTPADLYFFKQTEVVTEMEVIEGDSRPKPGTTTGQPFPKGTAGSEFFRIPALVTLPSGRLVAASDARWSHIMDACGIDTIVSYSDDNGKTWHYNFPNHFNDGTDTKQPYATAFIDPLMTVGKDGTLYLLVDLFPGSFAINTAPNRPDQATGFVSVNGVQRMPIYTSTSNQSDSNYTYYVGDFTNGYAPLLNKSDNQESGYFVDSHYYLYHGANKVKLYCQQLGANAWVHQNVFFYNAGLHVRNATYLWLVTSKDGGETWSDPTILNPQIRRTSGTVQFYGVGPGAVECLDDGTLVLPCYTFQVGGANNASQIASFIYSTDNGVTWRRSQDSTDGSHWSSESATLQIDENTIRHFYRDGYNTLWYTDHTRSGDGWAAGTPVDTGVPNTPNNQLSVLRYSKPIDGKTAILVSTATGGGRQNGRIYTFLLNDDKTLSLAYTYVVNDNGADYVYSSLAELKDGSIGLLYENENNPSAAITFVNYPIATLTPGATVDGKKTYQVPLYGTLTVTEDTPPTAAELGALNSSIVTAALNGNEVIFTGQKEGTTQYKSGGLTIVIEVVAQNLVPVSLNKGETHSVPVKTDRIDRNTNAAAADAVIQKDDQSVSFTGGQGTTGTDGNYTGAPEALARSLYLFRGNDQDGFTASSWTADGTVVYLDPTNTPG